MRISGFAADLALAAVAAISFAAEAPQARVAFETSLGRIVVALDAERAPATRRVGEFQNVPVDPVLINKAALLQ